jgi:hypothetical protein
VKGAYAERRDERPDLVAGGLREVATEDLNGAKGAG